MSSKIDFWKKQYNYCVEQLKKARMGQKVDLSIQCMVMGVEASLIKEANYAKKQLSERGVEVPLVK